jgi:chromosome segregation ATPase
MANYLPILAAVVAVVGCVSALLTRRKLQETQALLADTALRFDALSKQLKLAEQQSKTLQDSSDKTKQQAALADRQLEDVKLRLHEKSQEVERHKAELNEQVKRIELQKEHLKEQVAAMTGQLSEAVREKKAVLSELEKLQKETADNQLKVTEQLRGQLREAQQATQQAKREKQQIEAQMQRLRSESVSVSPEEIKKYRLKVARMEQLYTSMKGLRDMAEERNQNWETALRHFALYILDGQSAGLSPARPIGPLVGEALEKIGATLLVETASEAAQAERAVMAAASSIHSSASL